MVEYIIPGKRQLLVSDSFGGDLSASERFAREMVERNAELKTAFFSIIQFAVKNVPAFDQTIRTADYKMLAEGIHPFLRDGFR